MLILIFCVGFALIGGGLWGTAAAGGGLIIGAFVGAALDAWASS